MFYERSVLYRSSSKPVSLKSPKVSLWQWRPLPLAWTFYPKMNWTLSTRRRRKLNKASSKGPTIGQEARTGHSPTILLLIQTTTPSTLTPQANPQLDSPNLEAIVVVLAVGSRVIRWEIVLWQQVEWTMEDIWLEGDKLIRTDSQLLKMETNVVLCDFSIQCFRKWVLYVMLT